MSNLCYLYYQYSQRNTSINLNVDSSISLLMSKTLILVLFISTNFHEGILAALVASAASTLSSLILSSTSTLAWVSAVDTGSSAWFIFVES